MRTIAFRIIQGIETIKLELVPRKEGIKLRKAIVWVDSVRWIILQINTVSWKEQSVEVFFQYGLFSDKYWLPVEATATIDLSAFRGFSGFHGDSDRRRENEEELKQEKGKIIVRFYDYTVNEGIPDSVFDDIAEDLGW